LRLLKTLLIKFLKLTHLIQKNEIHVLEYNKNNEPSINHLIRLSTIENLGIIDGSFCTKSSNDACF